MREVLPYWLALLRFRKFGPVKFQRLQRHFKTMREAFFASAEEFAQAEIEPDLARMFISERGAAAHRHCGLSRAHTLRPPRSAPVRPRLGRIRKRHRERARIRH